MAYNNHDASSHFVVSTALSQISTGRAGQLPNIHILKHIIQRGRKQQLQLPNNYTDLNFSVLNEMTKIIDDNLFLQYDRV